MKTYRYPRFLLVVRLVCEVFLLRPNRFVCDSVPSATCFGPKSKIVVQNNETPE